jgi:hypothetical protein
VSEVPSFLSLIERHLAREFREPAQRPMRDLSIIAAVRAVSELTGDQTCMNAAMESLRPILRELETNGFTAAALPHWTPPWDELCALDPAASERAVLKMKDRPGEIKTAGETGVLAESLCWLSNQTNNKAHLETAQTMVRHEMTRRNFSDTPEAGFFAGSLLRAADASGDMAFFRIARDSVSSLVRNGYDPQAKRYKLWPADAGAWTPAPLAVAETCVRLWERTGDSAFKKSAWRWAEWMADALPVKGNASAGAETYGRAVYFLAHAADAFGDGEMMEFAGTAAEEAEETLWTGDYFWSRPNDEAMDSRPGGLGFLFLALIYLEGAGEPA